MSRVRPPREPPLTPAGSAFASGASPHLLSGRAQSGTPRPSRDCPFSADVDASGGHPGNVGRVSLTRGLALLAIFVPLVPLKALADGDARALVISGSITMVVWVATALRLRANLNDRGGYFVDPTD